MKKILFTFIGFILLSPILAYSLDVPEESRSEVAKAMKDGNNLFAAYLKGSITDNEIERIKSKIDDFCDFQYNAYLIDSTIYFIAEPPVSGGIVFGRHYKISDGKVIKSTITCFASPEEPQNTLAAFTTHLLSDTPTEFHVFVSLKYKKAVYIVSKIGIWKVERGRITFIEKRE